MQNVVLREELNSIREKNFNFLKLEAEFRHEPTCNTTKKGPVLFLPYS